MVALVENVIDIAKERARFRREEGLPDDNWQTANGKDLDACAAGYDIYRKDPEWDSALRERVSKAADMLRMKYPWFAL